MAKVTYLSNEKIANVTQRLEKWLHIETYFLLLLLELRNHVKKPRLARSVLETYHSPTIYVSEAIRRQPDPKDMPGECRLMSEAGRDHPDMNIWIYPAKITNLDLWANN